MSEPSVGTGDPSGGTGDPAREPVSAIVLAGGRAHRFGGPKLNVELDGVPLLHLAIEGVGRVADEVIVVGPASGDVDVPSGRRIVLLRDATPFPGPLAAVAIGLAAAQGTRAIVVGGDMPRLQAPVLLALLGNLASDSKIDAALLGSPDDAPRQTLPIALRVAAARRAADTALGAGESSLRALLDRLAVIELTEAAWRQLDPERATLLDIDEQRDLERLIGGSPG
jgi:molybdopterin-guanine dinucleotide biosynthesis protein A